MKNRLKELRQTLHLTQKAFAEKIGSKQNTVATYEIGRNNPSDPVIHSICREFNVNENWLRNGLGDMFLLNKTFSLDEYAKQNDLSELDKRIIKGYMDLNPDVRKAIINLFQNLSTAENIDTIYKQVPKTAEELERKFPPLDSSKINSKIG